VVDTTGSSSSSAGSGSGSSGSSSGGTGGSPAFFCDGKSLMEPGDTDVSITSSGEMREFRIHVPPGYDGKTPVALLIGLHGYTHTIDTFINTTHYREAVDKRGMIAVFPKGVAPFGVPGWNAGTCCGTASSQNTPDVQFMRDMVARLEQDYCIDPKRIFASGFSNGGMLSHRLACEFSDRIAAIGAVSGTMAIEPCIPKRAVPILHIHGTSDIIVPYNNSIGSQTVPQTIDGWVARNFCQPEKSVVYSKGTATCEQYAQCNADVQLCTIEGGSHEWPAGGDAMGVGDLPATEYILDFLEAHPMP
jgi:polyhydroxybutyrate depolymerase